MLGVGEKALGLLIAAARRAARLNCGCRLHRRLSMNVSRHSVPLSAIVSLLAAFPLIARNSAAQERRERTLDEVKAEAITRAENGMYPLIGLDPGDVREAFASVSRMDDDEWAAAFMKIADRYMAQGKAAETTDTAKASAAYVRAWRLYSFARWPVPSSPGKNARSEEHTSEL